MATAAASLRAQPQPEKARILIALAGKSAFCHLPLTIAAQLGYFRAEGLDVEISEFADSARVLQALASGSADVVAGAYDDTVKMQARGQKLQAFVLQGRAPAIAMGVSPRTLPHYRTAADLKGRKIGVSTPGSLSQLVAGLVLSRAGLKAAEVSFVAVGTAAGAVAAMRNGQIDAISNVDPVMTTLEQKGEIRIIADTRTLKGAADVFGGPMPAGCLYAPLEFVEKTPRTVQALTSAMVRSLKWLQTAGPSDIIKTVPEAYLLGDRALYLEAFSRMREAISPDGVMPDEGSRTAARVLASFDTTFKVDKVELSKTYTNEFVKRAKERFKA